MGYGGLSLFSAQELLNFGAGSYVNYYGYDYTGKLLNYNPTLADFFKAQGCQWEPHLSHGGLPTYLYGGVHPRPILVQ